MSQKYHAVTEKTSTTNHFTYAPHSIHPGTYEVHSKLIPTMMHYLNFSLRPLQHFSSAVEYSSTSPSSSSCLIDRNLKSVFPFKGSLYQSSQRKLGRRAYNRCTAIAAHLVMPIDFVRVDLPKTNSILHFAAILIIPIFICVPRTHHAY